MSEALNKIYPLAEPDSLDSKYPVVPDPKEPSKWEKVKYGAASMPGLGDSLDAYLERKMLTGHLQFHDDKGDWQWPTYVPASDNLRRAVEEGKYGDDRYAEDFPTVEDPALLVQRDETDRRLGLAFPDVHNTKYADSGYTTAGKFLGAVQDPSTLLPVGRTVAGAVGVGATIGGVDMAAYKLATEGSVEFEDIALGVAIGGFAGGLIKKGGDEFSRWLHGKRDNSVPVTELDMEEQLAKYGIKDSDPRKLYKQINDRLGIGENTEAQLKKQRKETRAAFKENPEDADFWKRYGESAGNIREITATRAEAARRKLLDHERNLKLAEIEHTYKQREFDVEDSVRRFEDDYTIARTSQIQKGIKTQLALSKLSDQPELPTQMEAAFAKLAEREGKTIDHIRSQFNQGGSINQRLLQQIGATGLGATVGYGLGGEEGAVMGAALGLGLPWTAGKIYSRVGKQGERNNSFIVNNMAGATTRPHVKLRTMGRWGDKVATRLRDTIESIDLRTAEKMVNVEERLFHLTPQAKKLFIHGLQGTVKDADQAPEILSIIKTLRTEFNDVIHDAVQVGIMSAKEGSKLIAKAKANGYWPRMYDEAFLSSTEGKEKWVEVFSKANWTKDSLDKTLKSILGENHKDVSTILSLAKKDGDMYYLPRDQALKLLERRGVARRMKRSSHLEHSRKLHVPEEGMLDDFLVKDPHAVLSSYFHDAYRRIEMARSFGANDQLAVKAIKSVEEEFGTPAATYMRDVYFTAVGDSRASSIAAQMAMTDQLRRFYGAVNAVETLKLSLAQTINAGQALVNGTTFLAGRVNPVTTYKIALKSLFKSFGSEGREIGARSGAAMEATLLQLLGEYSEASSIFGKQLRGKLAPFEVLNNPTEFLKFTQFIRVEKFQRTYAANMGKSYAEYLLSKKALIDTGEITGKAANKWIAKMKEIGISTHLPADSVPEGDLLRASLRFSNEVNFRNTPDRLPLAWQSPHAKIFTKFKSFAFHHGAFLKDNVYGKLKEGNPLPLINYLAIGTPLGMGVDEIRRMIKGDDSELTVTNRFLRGFTSVGGLGIMFDTLASTIYGAANPLMSLAGPAISDVMKLGHGTWKSVTEDSPKPIARALINTQVFPMKALLIKELKSDLKAKKGRRTRAGKGRAKRRTR